MNKKSQELIDYLRVEQLDKYLFRGATPAALNSRIYGGHILAQAMNAGCKTIDNGHRVHSLHGYFLRPGNAEKQIIFEVDPIRNGNSFTTRRVVAKQDGVAIFNCSVSFMAEEEGFIYQEPVGDVPEPESVESLESYIERNEKKYPDQFIGNIGPFEDWEIREVRETDPLHPEVLPPIRETWFRYKHPLGDNLLDHQTLLVYFSDHALMAAAYPPHQITVYDGKVIGTSLDHAMWFHEPLNITEWTLYRCDSPWANHGRGLNFGKLYRSDGTLVASTAQEGLMRKRRKK